MSEEDESIIKKTHDFYLILNWKTEGVRVRKTKPEKSELTANDIPIHTVIDVIVPKKPELEAKGTVKISRGKLADMVFDKF